jgi:hypothetical protein
VKDNWDRATAIATIFSLVAVPVILAVGGWVVQERLAEQSSLMQASVANQTNLVQQSIANQSNLTQRDIAALNVQIDYVNLAINILREQPNKGPPSLRQWAVAILKQNSPVNLSDEMQKALLSEPLRVPAVGGFSRSAFGTSFGTSFGEFGQPPGWQAPGWNLDIPQPARQRSTPAAKPAE